jgi:hypothetical protein
MFNSNSKPPLPKLNINLPVRSSSITINVIKRTTNIEVRQLSLSPDSRQRINEVLNYIWRKIKKKLLNFYFLKISEDSPSKRRKIDNSHVTPISKSHLDVI